MIINFSLENFGPIKDKQVISFEAEKYDDLESYYIYEPIKDLRLLKIIFLYGANASGKTTLLKGLEFLRDLILEPYEKRNSKLKFKPFLFDEDSKFKNSNIGIEFVQNEKKYFYEIVFNQSFIVKESLIVYNPKKSIVYVRETDSEKQLTDIKFGSKIRVSRDSLNTLINNTLWNNSVLGGFLKTNIDLIELREVLDWFGEVLKPLVFSDTDLEKFVTNSIESNSINKDNVIEVLQKADLNISNISIYENEILIPDGFVEFLSKNLKNEKSKESVNDIFGKGKVSQSKVEFDHTIGINKYTLPLEDQSEGTQRFYGFAGLMDILVRDSVVIPIDELESSLHPDLYIHFILMYLVNSKKSQLIATTHNREILNNKDIFRNDSIWFADKNSKGYTEIYSLEDFDSKTIRDTSNVYNAYKIGKLGGIPDLNDYFLNFKYEEDNDKN